MNSTTGEFSDTRRSLLDELYPRGTLSSAKRKPYVPRKVMNIKPLNLDGIKKELEEGLEEEESQSEKSKENVPDDEINLAEVQAKETTKLKRTCEDDILKDICNNVETNRNKIENAHVNFIEEKQNRTSDKTNINLIPEVKENSVICYGEQNYSFDVETNGNKIAINNAGENLMEEKQNRISVEANINVISEVKENNIIPVVKENNVICYGQKNDSFDLDFSALSLSTPVKRNEISFVTPSANKNLRVVKSEHTTREQFGGFVTPRVSNIVPKIQPGSIRRASLRTPINSVTSKPSSNVLTPSTNVINKHSSMSALAKEEPRNEQEHSLANSTKEQKFNTIKVNNVEYIILNMLGRGGSSEVFQCYNVSRQRHVAIKCVSLQNSASAGGYINEVKLLHQLQKCDKIIKMYDYEISESQKKLFVVLEKGGEDLSTILKQLAVQRSHIPMYMLLFYWMEMLYAVKQIHSHGVLHLDLKPSNFLKADGGLKLIDFGIASSVQTDMTSVIKTTPEGSCNYISPEALIGDSSSNSGNHSSKARYKIHFKSDVWSLGCILYQLVYRRTPFHHITQLWPKLATIMNPDHKIDYPEAQWVSPKIITTIQKCLQYNVKSRPSVDELIAEYESILHNI